MNILVAEGGHSYETFSPDCANLEPPSPGRGQCHDRGRHLIAAAETPARAQAFADLKTALVDYSKADTKPQDLRGDGYGKPADFNLAENTMRYLVHEPPKPDYDCNTGRLPL